MTDKDLMSRMLGIADPWRIVEVNFNVEGRLPGVIVAKACGECLMGRSDLP